MLKRLLITIKDDIKVWRQYQTSKVQNPEIPALN